MVLDDLPEVLDIEAASFPSPWPRSFFKAELRNPLARSSVLRAQFETHSRCAGYICTWFVRDELHILNLAIHPALRRRGLGDRLLGHALQEGVEAGLGLATLEARPSNQAALALYRKAGFRPVGIRPNYYYDTREDAVAMNLSLAEWADRLRGGAK
ncbi:MAG: ribosomal protein S18-alanine N-acetyltransferase [Nitrospirae bacterium]|nr:ribosomal protein S18-alanine N-acetyltransferase [Nitrospirota bacterium]